MTLTPAVAAKFANAVYGVQATANVENAVGVRERTLLAGGEYDFGRAKSVEGSAGVGLRFTSRFSMVVPCTGVMQGEYIVATRGTAGVADGLTDIFAAMEPGPLGCPVHAGFNRLAKTVMLEISSQLTNKNPTKIHLVGHSLGGAVSNILAAQFKLNGIGVELYTFGAPRPGLDAFRDLLAAKVNEENMHRAFNLSDPVPLLPIFPFRHPPGVLPAALVGSRHGIVNPWAHKMAGYKKALERDPSWENLKGAAHVTPMNIEELLALAAKQINMPGVSGGLYLLGRILRKILGGTNEFVGSQFTGSLTVLDQIGQTLSRTRTSSPEVRDQLSRFMRYTMLFAGIPFSWASIGTIITGAYITHVLTLILRQVVGQAASAIERPDQDA